MRSVKSSTLLDLSADHLIQFGWCQITPATENGERCPIYAIVRAGLIYWNKPSMMRAKGYFFRAISVKTSDEAFRWNDEQGRTRDEVVNALWQAADLARAAGD